MKSRSLARICPARDDRPSILYVAPLAAQDDVTLTFWFEGDAPAAVALFQEVADDFAAERPGVNVEITSFGFDDFLARDALGVGWRRRSGCRLCALGLAGARPLCPGGPRG